jgi:hypothetical protein
MAVRTQREQVERVVIGRILVDVMNLRSVLAAERASVVEFIQDRVLHAGEYRATPWLHLTLLLRHGSGY